MNYAPAAVVGRKAIHTKGQAMDFHIEGIALSNIQEEPALSMRAGGVGLYPHHHFAYLIWQPGTDMISL
ncbi:DUF882 domain-containing protein [Escherichia coli]